MRTWPNEDMYAFFSFFMYMTLALYFGVLTTRLFGFEGAAVGLHHGVLVLVYG